MDRRAYKLANEIKTKLPDEGQNGYLADEKTMKYKNAILLEIQKEREEKNKNMKAIKKLERKKAFSGASVWAAAACAAILFMGVMFWGGEVHAVIERISWSLGSALGLSGDLADYREVIEVPVADHGYVVTLQEVVAAEEKLVVNYTVQREDGEPMEQILIPSGSLVINGELILGGASGSGGFLNEEQTITGAVMAYDVAGVDMSLENTYQLKISEVGEVKGKWQFGFTAEGAELLADTVRIPLQKEFTLENQALVILDELVLNELEQRITFHGENISSYMLMLIAEDKDGHKVQFDTKTFQAKSGEGYMQNQEILYDGRIGESADVVKMTLYAVEMPKESGRMRDDYRQVGESFEVILR